MNDVTFIRIPKNASTSLYSFFSDKNTIRNEYLEADNARYLGIFEPSHCEIDYAVDRLGESILDKPTLAVVRNPFDRLVSMYFFARKYNLGALYGIDTSTFDSFAVDFYERSDNNNFFHAISQSAYVSQDKGKEVAILRFENLQEDLSKFIKDYKLENSFAIEKLQKLNGTTHSHYSDYYSRLSKSIVRNMWGCDLTEFAYSFKGEI